MNATQTTGNGRVRRTLASQLDRLDQILDGLGEGISDAVASAVQGTMAAAVKEAVQAVLVEALTNPALQQRLRQAVEPPPAKPPAKAGLLRKAWFWLGEKARQAGQVAKAGWKFVAGQVQENWVAASAFAGVVVYAARTRIASAASIIGGWF